MLKIKKNILINASPERVWLFLLELNYSMTMNRSHTNIEFPSSFKPELNSTFTIHQNFAITKYKFKSKIISKDPFGTLSILKTMIGKPNLMHSITYDIALKGSLVKLDYTLDGSLGSSILEMSLKPIVHGIIIDELRNLKSAIESSNPNMQLDTAMKKLNPI